MALRGALLGFGKIAESTHLPALGAAGLSVSAIADGNADRLVAAAKLLPGVALYEDAAALLATERPDFVDICTPPFLHFPLTKVALAAGAHVLCEKPLVLGVAQGRELASLAEAAERTVACMHNWTQAPILVRMREWVASGQLGPLQSVDLVTLRTQPAAVATDTANWRIDPERAGGGILYDHGWHGMSILLRLVGRRPVSVRAETARKRYLELAVEDTGEVFIDFDGGVKGRFEATWAAEERKNQAWAQCEEGTVEVENDRLRVTRKGASLCEEIFSESLAAGGYRPTWTAGIMREFRQEIDEPRQRGRALDEALGCMALLDAAYTSARQQGALISLPNPLAGC